ncbi:MAG: glucose-6-phosphate isomerase [Deltaproteobacteria bacterium]|nr:glucose-6-phosphate isomerase [Deltaproteobacteria bacterium]
MNHIAPFIEGNLTARLGPLQDRIHAAFTEFEKKNTLNRIFNGEYRVWKEDPNEIVNRMAWIQCPQKMIPRASEIRTFVDTVRSKGYDTAVLLGMGGSSLAPGVFREIYGPREGFFDLMVLDSTDPEAVAELTRRIRFPKTLFIVSTKSGSTVETLSFMKYFYAAARQALKDGDAGRHFIAITDPGSRLERIAVDFGFLKVFLNDPDIGGRYSVLSYFGLVPAALLGLDVEAVLGDALSATNPKDRSAAYLGVAVGESARMGKDKLTLILPSAIEPFGAWVEQLVAESLGKEGTGVLPVVGEPVGPPEVYADDRFFVHFRLNGKDSADASVNALSEAGHPVVAIALKGLHELSGEFFRWMMATAVAGAQLGVNPFDQPNVESTKVLAGEMVRAFLKTGRLSETPPDFTENGIQVFFRPGLRSIEEALTQCFGSIRKGKGIRGYVGIHAYLKPDRKTDDLLQSLRTRIRDRHRVAVTVGYGPRFLHSTGQLHKGDAGYGVFLQLTADSAEDVAIPDEMGQGDGKLTFGILKSAQALGDRQALLNAGRTVIRLHLSRNVIDGIQRLIASV